jgi:hypothetical protein
VLGAADARPAATEAATPREDETYPRPREPPELGRRSAPSLSFEDIEASQPDEPPDRRRQSAGPNAGSSGG